MSKRTSPAVARRQEPRPAASAPSEPVATRRAVLIQAAVVGSVALVARAVHFWLMRDSLFYDVLICDARQYDEWARRLAAGDWLGSEVFYQTPLYPYLLGVIYTLCGHSLWAVRIVQAVFGAAACIFAARAGAGFFSHRAGWASGLLLAAYPPAIYFDGIIQKASLDLVLMTALLWAIAATQRRASWLKIGLAGVLLGAMTLNRENAAALVPLLVAWIVWLSWSERAKIKLQRTASFAAGLALVLVPVGWRNAAVGGQFLLTTSQMGPNFYIGNHAGASGLYEPLRPGRGDPRYEALDARLLAEQDVGHSLSPAEISDYWMQRSWRDVREDPGAWLRLLAWKWLLTWNAMEFVDAESFRVHRSQSPLLAIVARVLHFGVLCPLAVVGLWLTRHDWRRLWILYAIAAAFAAAVTAFFVFARYRYPLVPVTVLFSGVGVVMVWDWFRGRLVVPSGEMLAAGGLAIAAAIFCNWPLGHLDSDEITYVTTANELWKNDRPAEALTMLQEAVRINPKDAVAYANMGSAALRLGRLDEAADSFRRAIALDPHSVQARYGLGELYERQQNLPAAIAEWREVVRIDPLFAESYRALGRVAVQTGDHGEAIRQLNQALRLDESSVGVRIDLARAYLAAGDTAAAARQLAIAAELTPSVGEANNLAWILATAPDASLRNAEAALRLAELACQATAYQEPRLLDTLAAALANAGKYEEAIARLDEALALAKKSGDAQLVEQLQTSRREYVERRPLRDRSLESRAMGASGTSPPKN